MLAHLAIHATDPAGMAAYYEAALTAAPTTGRRVPATTIPATMPASSTTPRATT